MNDEGTKLFAEGDFPSAAQTLEKAKLQAVQEFTAESAQYATTALNLAETYRALKEAAKAAPLYSEAAALFKKINGATSGEYAVALINQGLFLVEQGKSKEAELLLVEALKIDEATLGKQSPEYVSDLNNLADLYLSNGQIRKAIPLYEEALALNKALGGEKNPEFALSLTNLGSAYFQLGEYPKAMPFYEQALALRKELFGENHPEYALSLNNLASVYIEQGQLLQAEPLLVDACNVLQAQNQPKPYALALSNLASLYENSGSFGQAEEAYKNARQIFEAIGTQRSADYAQATANLAGVYLAQGLFTQAEPLFEEAAKIRAEVSGKESNSYISSLNDLALLYENQGLYAKAMPLYVEAVGLIEKGGAQDELLYITILGNLAGLYVDEGLNDKALPLYEKALQLSKQYLSNTHPQYIKTLNNLAFYYNSQAQYDKALPLLTEAVAAAQTSVGDEHPLYAQSLNNLAFLYLNQFEYNEAEPLLQISLDITRKTLGANHPNYATTLNSLASLYRLQSKFDEAEPLYREILQNKIAQIQNLLPSLAEDERKEFIQSIKFFFEDYYAFATGYFQKNPAVVAQVFDLQLIMKALIFNSTQRMQSQILNSGDAQLLAQYRNWKSERARLAKMIQLSFEEKKKQGITQGQEDQLKADVNRLEKELSQQSALFAANASVDQLTWKDVQKKLQPNEALVEIIRIRTFQKQPGKDTLYLALVLTSETTETPEMVVLDNGYLLENRYLKYYIKKIKDQSAESYTYEKFWGKIQEKIQNKQKVYVIADGVYHNINLNTIYIEDKDKFLGEMLDIQMLSNAKDILKTGNQAFAPKEVFLFGFPDYEGKSLALQNETGQDAMLAALNKEETKRQYVEANGKIAPLPGTKVEIENIAQYCTSQNIPAKIFLEGDAQEEAVKKLKSPQILHIATHGFFLTDLPDNINNRQGFASDQAPLTASNPLLRCGLFLANAEKGLQVGEIPGKDNGVLTAQEAMNLDLENTGLVVLSACETGLGEILNGEGVYGLQRAFQQAGAQSVIMSLWTVNDAATQEMMSSFYENLLVKKQPKREAFHNAQLALKKKYPEPYYWGAFIIIGE
jgi:CHAT domain-containing protein